MATNEISPFSGLLNHTGKWVWIKIFAIRIESVDFTTEIVLKKSMNRADTPVSLLQKTRPVSKEFTSVTAVVNWFVLIGEVVVTSRGERSPWTGALCRADTDSVGYTATTSGPEANITKQVSMSLYTYSILSPNTISS